MVEAIPSYKDLKSESFISKTKFSHPLKLQVVFPSKYTSWDRNCNPNMYIRMLSKLSFPTSQQINHSSRHDLLNSEKTQNHSPQVSSNITTKKQVIHIFSTFLTHAIPFYNYYSTLLLIVDLIYSSTLSVSNQHNPLICLELAW